jgi:hypothetical protein
MTGASAQSVWTSRTSDVTKDLLSVTWMGKRFVAVGEWGTILTSLDGVSWTQRTFDTTNALSHVIWTGTQVVAVGQRGAVFTSPDGISWTPRNSGIKGYLYSVTWTGTQLVAAGDSVTTSPDGSTWTPRPGTSGLGIYMTWTGSQLVAVGPYHNSTSPDGRIWTRHRDISEPLLGVTWTGKQLVAVGNNIFTSTDGINWAASGAGWTNLPDYPINVTWTGMQLVAVGNVGNVMTSLDGVLWKEQNTPYGISLRSVVSSGNLIVAVGDKGKILTSPEIPVPVSPGLRNQRGISLRFTSSDLSITPPNSMHGLETRAAVYTLTGGKSAEIPAGPDREIRMPIGNLAPGKYLFELKGPGMRITEPFQIAR